MTDDPEITNSALSRKVTREGITVEICIYRGADDPGWLLEVVDHEGGSTVWEDPFETDSAALQAAMRAIDEEGIGSFVESNAGYRSA